jgi:purine-binding chemotaxis protein CheW
MKYLTFNIGTKTCGLPVDDVTGIMPMVKVCPAPNSLHYVKGIVNLEGIVATIIDVNLRFGNDEPEHTEKTCIVTVNVGDATVGFVVDKMNGIVDISEDHVAMPTCYAPDSEVDESRFVTGFGILGAKIVLLLNGELLAAN